jgi:predicted ATPase
MVSRFIGRDQEVADVAGRIAGARLVTLTGVGGCGKTRLALEVARAIAPTYPDGVWLVELGPLSDPALVAQQVGEVLAVRETSEQPLMSALVGALASRRVLLVLDNCEHLLQACAELLNGLLRGCPALRVLATSREPVGIDGEVAWRVPSLTVPDPEREASVTDLEQNPSIQLFVERARSAQPRFGLTERNARAVAQICYRLDGIPLALELAAARIQALTAEQLALRLDQRFRLLTGGSRAALPRQQTLQATLDWSYDLLSKSERRLFERLAVFAGGWTLEAAEAVGTGVGVAKEDVLDLLAQLVRKSLVLANEAADGTERYALLETVRDYAREKLLGRGGTEVTAARERHAAFYSDLASQLYPTRWVRGALTGAYPGTDERHDRIGEVHENLRAALGWWLDMNRPKEGLGLAVTMGEFWLWRGVLSEARFWLQRMLDLTSGTLPSAGGADGSQLPVPLRVRAEALMTLGVVVSWQGDQAHACAVLESGVGLAHELDDQALVAFALTALGLALWHVGAQQQATAALDESLRISRELSDEGLVVLALRNRAIVARWQAQYARANTLLGESAEKAHQLTPHRGFQLARSLSSLGRVAYLQGQVEQARTLLCQAFEVIRESQLGGQPLADSLDWLAAVEGAQGDAVRAARLFGAAEAQWRASGAVRYAPDQPLYDRDVASVHTDLDEHVFEGAWEEGKVMNAQRAISYAMEEIRPDPSETVSARV